jgi:hypothetical protein
MPAELDDPRATKAAMREIASVAAKEEIEAAVKEAVKIANRGFSEAADDPPADASLEEWNLEPIIESVELRWEQGEPEGELKQGNALIAEWTHPHTNKMEVGVRPHEIEGDDFLRWIDRETGEEIFRQKVDHPGNPGLGAIRNGFSTVLNRRFD